MECGGGDQILQMCFRVSTHRGTSIEGPAYPRSSKADKVEHLAHLVVTGNVLNAQQHMDIVVAIGVLQGMLIVQKGRIG